MVVMKCEKGLHRVISNVKPGYILHKSLSNSGIQRDLALPLQRLKSGLGFRGLG